MRLTDFLLIMLYVGIETAEQCFYRKAGRKPRQFLFFAVPAVLLNLIGLYVSLVFLAVVNLGLAMPLMAFNNVTVALAGRQLFGERIDRRRWIGIALITAGVVLVAFGGRPR